MLTVSAFAKINLHLDIVSRLPNGYHSLFMVMQSVSLRDRISLSAADDISLTCSEASLPADRRNLAFRAAELFFEKTKLSGGVHIDIEKNIPMQAGLGGGSADAAAVLGGVNRMYGSPLSADELCAMGMSLGADVPFCVRGGLQLSLDMGQVLSPLPVCEEYHVVIAKPTRGVSTAEAYAAFDSSVSVRHPNNTMVLNAFARGSLTEAVNYTGNVFEQFIEVPERIRYKAIMREHDCLACAMSGSGPSIFGLFKDEENRNECARELSEICENVFCAEPVYDPDAYDCQNQ